MLVPLELPRRLDEHSLDPECLVWIEQQRHRVQRIEDDWPSSQHESADEAPLEQFVCADAELIGKAITWIGESRMAMGTRFLEWGCGIGTITGVAALLGWDAIGIEGHPGLAKEAIDRLRTVGGEAILGNFLPEDVEEEELQEHLDADDWYATGLAPSLGHDLLSAYEGLGLSIEDFALVYSYPWPGESPIHQKVFEQYASPGALHLEFRGPNEVQLWRKTA
ncbi:MAG: class I SAM-dependent methyltransferase [Planctomycetota bacterium]